MPGLPRMHHCAKKALLIGVQYSTTLKEVDPVWELRGAHEDPKTVQQLLIGTLVIRRYDASAKC